MIWSGFAEELSRCMQSYCVDGGCVSRQILWSSGAVLWSGEPETTALAGSRGDQTQMEI